MASDDTPLVKMPNPFELFEKKKEGLTNTSSTQPPALVTPPSQTDDNNMQVNPKISLFWVLVGMFFGLFFVIAMLYYIYANFFLIDKLFQVPYYNITNFWRYYRAPILSGKLSIFIILWLLVFGINALIFDFVFDIKDTLNIFYISTMYFVGIVGSTFLIIGNIPSLVEIFENTIGYSVLCIPFLYNIKKVTSVFKSKHFKSREFDVPYSFLLTTFDLPSFNDLFQKLVEEGRKVKSGTSAIDQADGIETDFYLEFPENISERAARYNLLKMVLAKNNIGHMTWTFLGSFISIMLTINTIVK
jgi:hypothetical protein